MRWQLPEVVRQAGRAAAAFFRPGESRSVAITGDYDPMMFAPKKISRDLPRLSADYIREMLTDEAVTLGLAARLAPIMNCEFAFQDGGKTWVPGVRAANPAVGDYVYRTLRRLWRRGSSRILNSAQTWGWGGGELTVRRMRGMLEADQILVRDYRDVRPVIRNGRVAGVQFSRIVGAPSGKIEVDFPYSVWHTHDPYAGQNFGWSSLIPVFSPWWDKHGVNGAIPVRRLFFVKDGYRGAWIEYPKGLSWVTAGNTSKQIPNYELAMQIMEKIRSGSVYAVPYESNGKDGANLWKVHEATVPSNPAHILQYPKDLDTQILNALGIADDVLKSEATGSWAGKVVPQQATYMILEQWLADYIADLEPVIEKLVEINFGPGQIYEIETKPLAEQISDAQNAGKGELGGDDSFDDGGGNDPSGMQNRLPQQGPQLLPRLQQPQRMSSAAELRDLVISAVGDSMLSAKDIVEHAQGRLESMLPDKPKYSSTQFNLDGDMRLRVEGLGAMIAPDDLAGDGVELTPHITVKYGLHTDDAEELRALAAKTGPIAVQFGAISVFEHYQAERRKDGHREEWDVVKIDVESEGLRALNKAISSRFEHTDSFPTYKPHVTIAYVKPGLGQYYADKLTSVNGAAAVFDRLVFSNKAKEQTSLPLLGAVKFSSDATLQQPPSM